MFHTSYTAVKGKHRDVRRVICFKTAYHFNNNDGVLIISDLHELFIAISVLTSMWQFQIVIRFYRLVEMFRTMVNIIKKKPTDHTRTNAITAENFARVRPAITRSSCQHALKLRFVYKSQPI